MKKGKKLIALIVGVLMVAAVAITVAACPSGNQKSVDVFWYDFVDPYLATVREELDARLLGVNLTNHNGENDQGKQTEQITTAIAQKTDLLIVNIVKTGGEAKETQLAISNAAKTAGIPVIFFNREVEDEVITNYAKSVFVGTEAADAGHKQGKMIGDYLIDTLDGSGKSPFANDANEIPYIMIYGQYGNEEAFYRSIYAVLDAQAILDANETGLKLVSSDLNGNEMLKADKDKIDDRFTDPDLNEAVHAILDNVVYADWGKETKDNFDNTVNATTVKDIGIIISNHDDSALIAIESLNDLDYNKGTGKFIPIFGVDATASAIEAITAKKLTGTIEQTNVGMATVVAQLAYNVVRELDLLSGTVIYNFKVTDEVLGTTINKIQLKYGIYKG